MLQFQQQPGFRFCVASCRLTSSFPAYTATGGCDLGAGTRKPFLTHSGAWAGMQLLTAPEGEAAWYLTHFAEVADVLWVTPWVGLDLPLFPQP